MMHKTELEWAAEMLERAADHFSDHICNDMDVDRTPENEAFMLRMIEAGYGVDGEIHGTNDYIYTMDWMVMSYCAKYIKQLIKDLEAAQ